MSGQSVRRCPSGTTLPTPGEAYDYSTPTCRAVEEQVMSSETRIPGLGAGGALGTSLMVAEPAYPDRTTCFPLLP